MYTNNYELFLDKSALTEKERDILEVELLYSYLYLYGKIVQKKNCEGECIFFFMQ